MLTEAARKHKVVTQMGNQGHSGDGTRLICEWIADGAIGAGARGARLDQPARLAAGHRGGAAQGDAARPGRPGLGPVDRPGALSPVSSHLSCRRHGGRGGISAPARWATWAATSWTRRSGRLKLKYPVERRRLHLDLLAGLLEEDRAARTRTYPALDDRALQVPGAGRHAGGEADLVGRRHDAAAARGARSRPPDGRQRRRRALPRRQGQADVRLLRQQPALDSRSRDEGVSSRRRKRWTAFRAARRATRRIGCAPARAASRPARISTTPARSRKWCSWATWPSASPTASCSGTARRWR